jgi:outer membrane receptor protein involved in Fe transport
VDGRFIHGESDEAVFASNAITTLAAAGGRSNQVGAYGEVAAALRPRMRISAGLRLDRWDNLDGFNRSTRVSNGAATLVSLPAHQETAFSPRAGLVYDLAARWQLTASAYGGFRAPTLNELYRSFRLGNILTLANDQLRAEHLAGGETGIRYLHGRLIASAVYFQENVDDPVGNITQSVSPALITRERENMGALRARGVDGDFWLSLRAVQFRAGYEYVHSLVSSFSANQLLVGMEVPQTPAHVFTVSALYNAPRRWTLTWLLRAASRQFDDDLNQFELNRYSVLGVSVSKQTGMLTWFASASNLLDARIETAATPVLNYASPRIISGGVRFSTGR